MNILAEQLAELLNIGIEQAVKLYPILRTQFVWYEMLNTIGALLLVGGVIITTLLLFFVSDEYVEVNKIVVAVLLVSTIAAILGLTLLGVRPIFAPDLMLIQRILGG